jgi:excisionase family DNA binding protein
MSEGPLFVGVREAARILGTGRDSTYDLVKSGRLPSVRIGRRYLIPRDALIEWVRRISQEEGPKNELAVISNRTSSKSSTNEGGRTNDVG